jgi:hypothetical protein
MQASESFEFLTLHEPAKELRVTERTLECSSAAWYGRGSESGRRARRQSPARHPERQPEEPGPA